MIKHIEQWIEAAGNDWDRTGVHYTVMEWRRGWPGAWDSLKAALFKKKYKDRPQVPFSYTVSLYIKPGVDYSERYIWGCQMEQGERVDD